MTERRRWAAVAGLAALPLLAAVGAAKAAESGFVAPGAHGVVDFGDSVPYQLSAPCESASVHAEVTTPEGAVSGPSSAGCGGRVALPTLATLQGIGFVEGEHVTARLVDGSAVLPLTLQRTELDQTSVVTGSPVAVPSDDPHDRPGRGLRVLRMTSGDTVDLGTADLASIFSVTLRSAVDPDANTAQFIVRAGDPTTGLVVAAGDLGYVGKSPANGGSWPNPWYTLSFKAPPGPPDAGALPAGAQELYFELVSSPKPVLVNWLDLNGTGAKDPTISRLGPDPQGTQMLFDGSSAHGFTGWQECGWEIPAEAQADGGGMRSNFTTASLPQNAPSCATGPTATYTGDGAIAVTPGFFQNVDLRLRFRFEHFEDNGGVLLGGQEFQMHDRGEWFTGGYWAGASCADALVPLYVASRYGAIPPTTACGYVADRIKTNTFPAWSEMEIIQNGPDYLVRINGRDVTRYHRSDLNTANSLQLSNFFGSSNTVGPLTEWDHVWLDDIRVHHCAGASDPACSTATTLEP